MPEAVYFLKRGEKLIGPHNLATVKKLSEGLKIKPGDLISRSKDGPWHKFGDVEEKLYGAGKSGAKPEPAKPKAAVNPNLMACPDCDGKMSKKAHACPHCGSPNETLVVDLSPEPVDDSFGGVGLPPVSTFAPVATPQPHFQQTPPATAQVVGEATEEKGKSNVLKIALILGACLGSVALLGLLTFSLIAWSSPVSVKQDEKSEPKEYRVEIRKELFLPIHRLLVQHKVGQSADSLQAELKLLEPAIQGRDEEILFGICEKTVDVATVLMVLDIARKTLVDLNEQYAVAAQSARKNLSPSNIKFLEEMGGDSSGYLEAGQQMINMHAETELALSKGLAVMSDGNAPIDALFEKFSIKKVESNGLTNSYVEYSENRNQMSLAYRALVTVFGDGLHGKTPELFYDDPETPQLDTQGASSEANGESAKVATLVTSTLVGETEAGQLDKEEKQQQASQIVSPEQKQDADDALTRLCNSIGNLPATSVNTTALYFDEGGSDLNDGRNVVEVTLLVSAGGGQVSVEFKLGLTNDGWKPLYRRLDYSRNKGSYELLSVSYDEDSEREGMSGSLLNWSGSQGNQLIEKLFDADSWLG